MNASDIVITLPDEVREILAILQSAGHEAYVVGGCVRDSVLSRNPADWDITTDASPEQVKACFKRTVDTGIQHGTVTVLMRSGQYEVTTYRIDGTYADGRHPDHVTFTRSLREDLARRDFTINAMAYNETEGLVDCFGGLSDLKQGVIRAVGDPAERFREDALRMMRAVRFAAQLGYTIAPETEEAIREEAPGLSRVSAERIRVELVKLLLSDHPGLLRTAVSCGLTAVFLPELDRCMDCPQHNPHHRYTVGEHIIRSVEAVRADETLRLTMLFHDLAKPLCRTTDENGIDHFHGHAEKGSELAGAILRRLKFDNDTRSRVMRLVKWHDLRPEFTKRAVRRAMVRVGPELFPLLMEVKVADGAAQSPYRLQEKLEAVTEWNRLAQEIREENDALCIAELAVNGRDLIAAGIRPGRELGALLQQMLEDVLEAPEHNEKEYLMQTYVKNGPNTSEKVQKSP